MQLIEKGRASPDMIIIQFLIRVIFIIICGWTGSVIVRLVTLGKVDIAWGLDYDAETSVAEWIGSFFWLLVAAMTVWAV